MYLHGRISTFEVRYRSAPASPPLHTPSARLPSTAKPVLARSSDRAWDAAELARNTACTSKPSQEPSASSPAPSAPGEGPSERSPNRPPGRWPKLTRAEVDAATPEVLRVGRLPVVLLLALLRRGSLLFEADGLQLGRGVGVGAAGRVLVVGEGGEGGRGVGGGGHCKGRSESERGRSLPSEQSEHTVVNSQESWVG